MANAKWEIGKPKAGHPIPQLFEKEQYTQLENELHSQLSASGVVGLIGR